MAMSTHPLSHALGSTPFDERAALQDRSLLLGPAAGLRAEVLAREVLPLIRTGQGRRVLYLVPGALLQRRLEREALAALGGAALDLPFATLESYTAHRFRELPGARRQVSAVERRVLLERALEELDGRAPWPGLVERIGRLVQELSAMGILDGAALTARLSSSGSPGPRERRLAAILDRYAALLDARRLADGGRARQAVAEALTSAGEPLLELLVLDGFAALSPLDARVVAAIAARARRAVAIVDAEWSPGAGGGAPSTRTDALLQALVGAGFAPERRERAAPSASRPAPELLRSESAAQEVLAIARRIREVAARDPATRADLSRIVVLLPRLEATAPLVRELFPRAGIPFALLRGEPLSRTAAARVLLEWIDCVLEGFERGAVARALLAPSISFRSSAGVPLDMPRLDRIAREAGIAGPIGRAGWMERLRAHRVALDLEADRLAGRGDAPDQGFAPSSAALAKARRDARTIEMGLPVLDEAFAALEALAEPAAPRETEERIQSLLGRLGIVARASQGSGAHVLREGAALRAVAGVLRDLTRGLGTAPIPLERYRAALRAAVAGESTGVPVREGPGRVLVTSLSDARGLDAAHVIVGGLDARSFPGARPADLFLGEASRRALGLEGPEERRIEARSLLAAAIGAGALSTTLLFASDGAEGDAALSPLVQELVRATPGVLASRPAPLLVLGETAPPEALSRAVMVTAARAAPGAPGPFEGRIEGAALERLRGRLFEADGAARLSTSALETYALCPFRAFAGRLLGIEALPDAEEDESAREIGERLHWALESFYDGFRRERGRAWLTVAVPRLRSLVERELRLPGKDAFWEAKVDRLLQGLSGVERDPGPPGPLRAFLEREAFDEPPGGCSEPEVREAAFSLEIRSEGRDGALRPIRVRGQIDRADLSPRGDALVVYDYKSGRHPPHLRDTLEGRRFQLPIYLLAARHLLGGAARPLGAAYLPLAVAREVAPRWLAEPAVAGAKRATGGIVPDLGEVLARVPRAIGAVLDGVAGGIFHPGDLPPQRKGCDYCEYRRVCRVDHERMAALFRDGAEPFFRPVAIAPDARATTRVSPSGGDHA